jgi:hypothetical protein
MNRAANSLSSHAADICSGQWIMRFLKYLFCGSGLDQTPGSVLDPEQGGIIRDASGLS